MDLISPAGFEGSYEVMVEVLNALEYNDYYKVSVLCEPQLGKRGLYPTISQKGSYDEVLALCDFLAYADGKRDLLEISDRIRRSVKELIPIIKKLEVNSLLVKE